MADADATLEILIKSVSDATGYRMNEAEAQKLKDAVVKTSAATTVANEEDVKGTEKAIVSKRELRHIIGVLGGEAVPELSRALSALAFGGGPLAAILLLVGAFEMVRNKIKAAQEADEEFNQTAANGDFAGSIKAAADLMQDIVNAQDEYLRKLKEIQKGEHGVTAELAIQLKLIAAIAAARQEQTGAQKTLALEQVKEDEILGRITKSEADARRGQIEKTAIIEKARADDERFQAEQLARAAELNKAAGQQAALDKAKNEAENKLNQAKADQAMAVNPPKIEDVRKAQAEAEKALGVFQSEWEIPMGVDSPLPPGTSERSRIDQQTAKEKQLQADLLQQKFYQAQRAGKEDVPLLEHDYASKSDAALDNQKAIAKIAGDLNEANRDYTDPQVTRARATAENANLRTADLAEAGQLFGNAKKDVDEITRTANSKTVTPQSIAAARAAVADLASALHELPALINDLRRLGTDAATIRAMQTELKNLAMRSDRPNQ